MSKRQAATDNNIIISLSKMIHDLTLALNKTEKTINGASSVDEIRTRFDTIMAEYKVAAENLRADADRRYAAVSAAKFDDEDE